MFKSYEKPSSAGGSRSFATFMIIGREFRQRDNAAAMLMILATCFFLGILFSSFPYDYPILWTSATTPEAYLSQLETHLKFMHASPPIIARILHIAVSVGFLGLFIKLFKPSESNLLFDGASLVLYLVGVVIYVTNIIKGMRIVTLGLYEEAGPSGDEPAMNREDSLKVLAASNTILALVLVGVLVLQAGQWYAERKDADDNARYDRELEEKMRKGSGQLQRGSLKKNK